MRIRKDLFTAGAFSSCKYLKSVIVREYVNIEENAFGKSGKITIIRM